MAPSGDFDVAWANSWVITTSVSCVLKCGVTVKGLVILNTLTS